MVLFGDDRARLKESMLKLLWYFSAMTGRMNWDEGGKRWVVECNDARVRAVDARAEATLDEWITTASAAEERQLVNWEPMGNDPSIWSPFYVQITDFKDKGYAIGLSCTHMHSDPTCATLLIKAWSNCHRTHMHSDATCATLLIKAWSDYHRRASIANPPFFHPLALIPRLKLFLLLPQIPIPNQFIQMQTNLWPSFVSVSGTTLSSSSLSPSQLPLIFGSQTTMAWPLVEISSAWRRAMRRTQPCRPP